MEVRRRSCTNETPASTFPSTLSLSLSYSQLSALLLSPLNSHILNSLCPYDLQQDSHEPTRPAPKFPFRCTRQPEHQLPYAEGAIRRRVSTYMAPRLSRGPQEIVSILQDLGSLGVGIFHRVLPPECGIVLVLHSRHIRSGGTSRCWNHVRAIALTASVMPSPAPASRMAPPMHSVSV